METKIFGRLTAWQNWIFQRPNAVGEKGALQAYGQQGQAGVRLEGLGTVDRYADTFEGR